MTQERGRLVNGWLRSSPPMPVRAASSRCSRWSTPRTSRTCLDALAGNGVRLVVFALRWLQQCGPACLAASSDVISLHVPLTPETHHLVSRLLTFQDVLITAHQAFLTPEALSEIARVTVQNVGRLQSGDAFLDGTTL